MILSNFLTLSEKSVINFTALSAESFVDERQCTISLIAINSVSSILASPLFFNHSKVNPHLSFKIVKKDQLADVIKSLKWKSLERSSAFGNSGLPVLLSFGSILSVSIASVFSCVLYLFEKKAKTQSSSPKYQACRFNTFIIVLVTKKRILRKVIHTT